MTDTPTGVIRTRTCYTIDCADCGPECWHDFTPHFTSAERLCRSLFGHGWTRDRHGRWLCEQCTHRADCERDGHRWSAWQPSCFDAEVMDRWCEHCGEDEATLAALLPGERDT